MKNNEQLRECINSGQVSAAQVVAHAENGDFKPLCARCGEFGECIPRGTDSCEPSMSMFASPEDYNKAAAVREGGDGLPVMPNPSRLPAGNYPHGVLAYSYDQMRAYATAALAAKQEEVARLREALQNLWNASKGTSDAEISARLAARRVLNHNQGETK